MPKMFFKRSAAATSVLAFALSKRGCSHPFANPLLCLFPSLAVWLGYRRPEAKLWPPCVATWPFPGWTVTEFPNCCSRSSPKWILCFSTTGKHCYCCGNGSERVLLTVHLLALWYNENGPNRVFSRLTSSKKLASTQVYLGLQRVFCTYWAFKFVIQKDASEKKKKRQKKLR